MSAADLDELFREVVLDHYRRPRHHGPLAAPTAEAQGMNPVCGDEVRLQLRLDGDRIVDVGFEGQGCSISQASASILAERVLGRPREEALADAHAFRSFLRGERPSRDLGDLEALEGVARFPARVKCALLSWNVLEQALAKGPPGG